MSSIRPDWIIVTTWQDIYTYLDTPKPIDFLIPSATMQRLGAPVIKVYQDFLVPWEGYSLTVECETVEQALSCIYHGLQKILYRGKGLPALQSLALKTKTHLILK